MEPKISIIILNWNGWQDTIECLESVYEIDYSNYDVIIVDNGSKDNSIYKIHEYCMGNLKVKSNFFGYKTHNKQIEIVEIDEKGLKANLDYKIRNLDSNRKIFIIKNDKNYGFAKGNNIGINFSINNLNPDYILLLNNDTVVNDDFLKELIKCFKNHQNIAAIQPSIFFYDQKEKIQSIGGTLNIITGKESDIIDTKEDLVECDRLIGASMLIKRSALEKIGLIDERYFLYMEETDWCYRAKKANYSLKGCKKSKIWHKMQKSLGSGNTILDYYWTRNMILFYRKNSKRYLPTFIVFFSIRILKQIFFLILNRKSTKGIIYGLFDGILGKKGILKRSI